MRLQRDSYAPKKCAFDAANVQFLRAHLCKSHPVLQHGAGAGLKRILIGAFGNGRGMHYSIASVFSVIVCK